MTPSLHIHTVVSLPFEENSFVVHAPGRTDALVIDPGLDPDAILDLLGEHGLTVAAILNTHGHADHIGGNAAVKQAFPDAPIVIGAGDAPMLTNPMANLSGPFGMPLTSPPADRTVREGDVLDLAGITLEVLEVPGHTPGHVVFLVRGTSPEPLVLFGGDVLFRGSIGRSDFPGGNGPMLIQGIRDKLLTLPPETRVYSGHGPVTTIGQEARTNPFL